MIWKTSKRVLAFDRPLIMGILNVTPDSFSDGGKFASLDAALRQAEQMIAGGADIIDVGGESTRPGSRRVSEAEEIERVVPVIEAVASRFDIPISIDTCKSTVAKAGVSVGAEIVNDISGLRFDEKIAEVAAACKTGLVLMHSRGEFETMHSQPPVEDIFADVTQDFQRAIDIAQKHSVAPENIVLDVGIGFGKTQDQNLELIAKLDRLAKAFANYPILVGASRKSFIGRLLAGAPMEERLGGSIAAASLAVWNGAKIVRVHDVAATRSALTTVDAIRNQKI